MTQAWNDAWVEEGEHDPCYFHALLAVTLGAYTGTLRVCVCAVLKGACVGVAVRGGGRQQQEGRTLFLPGMPGPRAPPRPAPLSTPSPS